MGWPWSGRGGERRKWPRTECRSAATLRFKKFLISGQVLDIGCGGCLFQPARPLLFAESGATLAIGSARLPVRVLRKGARGQHLCFEQPLPTQADVVATLHFQYVPTEDPAAADWLPSLARRRPPGGNA